MNEAKLIVATAVSAAIGGVVMYIRSDVFGWKRLIVEIVSALFVGAVVGSALIQYTDLPYYFTCSICALLGSMSSKVIDYLQSSVTLAFSLGTLWIRGFFKKSTDDPAK